MLKVDGSSFSILIIVDVNETNKMPLTRLDEFGLPDIYVDLAGIVRIDVCPSEKCVHVFHHYNGGYNSSFVFKEFKGIKFKSSKEGRGALMHSAVERLLKLRECK